MAKGQFQSRLFWCFSASLRWMCMRAYVHDVDFAACIGNSRWSLGGGYMQVADTMYPSRLAVLTHPDLGACREGSSLRHICHVAYYHMYVCIRYMYYSWDMSAASTFGQNALHPDSREPLGARHGGAILACTFRGRAMGLFW